MKFKIITLGLLIILSCSLLAQENGGMKRSIGFTFSAFEGNDITNSARMTLLGGASYSGKGFYTVGVNYVQPVRSWIDIESGVEYSNHTITVESMSQPEDHPPANKDISLINIPITARINFLKYFFINGGLMLDLDMGISSPIDSQTGVGALLGIGAKYSLNNGLGAFVNGYYKYHSLIPLSANNYDYRWRLIEGGLRMGVTYSF
ncbi:MAG: outer membrane beta-barrel protein [Tenuifilaceae bacterium]|nr:outer membrane beta-barrel protein [Tenuifilaceae bacterium]